MATQNGLGLTVRGADTNRTFRQGHDLSRAGALLLGARGIEPLASSALRKDRAAP